MSFPRHNSSSFFQRVLLQRVFLPLLPLLLLGSSARAADAVEAVITDALGNVRVITDDQGNILERHDYLPFGEECTTGPCASNAGAGAGQPRKFTGKERDAETGLDYFGARYYRANTGRFTTTDPVYTWRENLVDPQRWNRYAYARNNPLKYNDPDGRVFKLAVYGYRIGRALYKGQDVYSTVSGIAEASGTIFSGDARVGTADRLLATGSLLGEISGASDALSAGKNIRSVAKRGPKPKGVGPHNQTIDQRIEELNAEGMEHAHGGTLTEEVIPTPGGCKSCRRPDISMTRPDGTTYRENVGRTRAGGEPVSREVGALDDLERATGERPGFTPYDRKE